MNKRDLNICFKGDRSYLHGSDVYDASIDVIGELYPDACGRVRYSFHSIASSCLQIHCGRRAELGSKPAQCVAELHIGGADDMISGWIVETGKEVKCRVPYDEDAISAECTILDESIRLGKKLEFRPIEIVIAMTKRMHHTLVSSDATRWMFTRLDISRPLNYQDRDEVVISLRNRLGEMLTKSEIRSRGILIGNIYFSLVAS